MAQATLEPALFIKQNASHGMTPQVGHIVLFIGTASDSAACMVVFVIIFVLVTVCLILRPHGMRVQTSSCAFIAALVATQLIMKYLSSPPLNYRFPASVTALHFLTVWCFCICFWVWRGDVRKLRPSSMGTTRQYLMAMLPIAVSLPLSVLFNNQAMIYVGAGANAVIGTLAPVSTALLQQLFGRALARLSWAGIFFACVGALVITWGEIKGKIGDVAHPSAVYGVALSFTSVFCRSLKVVMQDKLLQPAAYVGAIEQAKSTPHEPLHLWALQAPLCCIVAICNALICENQLDAWHQLTSHVIGAVACTCVSATCLNILGMITIRDLGASSMSIVGKLNTIIVVALSIQFLGEDFPLEVLAGTGIVLLGVGIFEYGESRGHRPKGDSLPK